MFLIQLICRLCYVVRARNRWELKVDLMTLNKVIWEDISNDFSLPISLLVSWLKWTLIEFKLHQFLLLFENVFLRFPRRRRLKLHLMFIFKAEKAIEISVHNHHHPDRDQRDMNDIQLLHFIFLKSVIASHNNTTNVSLKTILT